MLDEVFRQTEERMDKAIETTEREFTALRTGRASVAIVDSVTVSAYGSETPLNQVASISTPDAATIMIQPWDAGILKVIEKALLEANLGMTPNSDGRAIRLNIPALTEERRKEIVKQTHKVAERGRVAVRGIRRQANEEIKATEKKHDIGEDESRRYLDLVQKKTDQHIKRIDELLAKKEKEIMQV